MDSATRMLVWTRAAARCEYCLVQQKHVESIFHIEHIVPKKHGGSDHSSNLCLACAHCNLFKGSDLTGIDPGTGEIERLFNPRTQIWSEHFLITASMILGLTPAGRTTARVLSMNRELRLQFRAGLIARGDFP